MQSLVLNNPAPHGLVYWLTLGGLALEGHNTFCEYEFEAYRCLAINVIDPDMLAAARQLAELGFLDRGNMPVRFVTARELMAIIGNQEITIGDIIIL
jgi:hypothetical protein